MTLTAGVGGVRRHACAALADGETVLGVCEQERITRVRGAHVEESGLPDQALDALLAQAQMRRSDITRLGMGEEPRGAPPWPTTRFEHHEAHACASFLTSPFSSATIVICDHELPGVSVWSGQGAEVQRIDWPWSGASFSDVYSECSTLVGFDSGSGDQRFEALARMMAASPDDGLPCLFTTDGHRIETSERWRERISERVGGPATNHASSARVAAALQRQIGELLVETLRDIKKAAPSDRLCLGGSLFYHSSINSVVRQSGLFERVFVPANPGNAGLAVGAAMRLAGLGPAPLSAFMGPSFDPDEIKSTLDNCKLRYDWIDEEKHRRAGRAPSPARPARRLVRGREWSGARGRWAPARFSRARSRRTCSRT